MSKKNLLVIFGGVSPEHEISKASAVNVISNISEEKYNIIPLYITINGHWLLYDGGIDNLKNIQWDKHGTHAVLSPDRSTKGLLRIVGDKVKTVPVDVIFPVLHGANGEDGSIQGLFELSGIPYVGSSVMSSAVAMDKSMTKMVINNLKINQAEYLIFHEDEMESFNEISRKVGYKLRYPCFVKPANTGSSRGISKVHNKKELKSAMEKAFMFDNKIICEKAVNGRELEVAVIGDGRGETKVSAVGEIISANEFYDYEAKYNNSQSQTIVNTELSKEISDEIRTQALAIFKTLCCYGISRVDFFLENETNRIIFNEINTMPGFTSISMYSKLLSEMGIDGEKQIDYLVELALSRELKN